MKSLMRMTLVAALLGWGCGTESTAEPTEVVETPPSEAETTVEASEGEAGDVEADVEADIESDEPATVADFEEEANETITEDNLEEQVANLEAALGEDDGDTEEGSTQEDSAPVQ